MICYGDLEVIYPVRIVMTDEVRELMKSNEAKSYLKQIERAGSKLQKFIEENRSDCGRQNTSSGAS
jgi:hypothetical protein